MTAASTPVAPTETRIDSATLAGWRRDGTDITVLDVRSPGEFGGTHIPGSYNVPLDTLGEHAAQIQRHVEHPVVLVCRSGMRASQAEQKLAAAGMSNVFVLEGGMVAWERSGGEVNRGKARWDIERQVRLVAGSLVFVFVIASIWVPALRYLAGAMGLGLAVAALANSCVMGALLAKLPYNRAGSCDVNAVIDQLTRRSAPASG
jgi:rhodanese-related sulfurtransferase